MLSCFTDTDGGRGEAVGQVMEGEELGGGARGSRPVKMTQERSFGCAVEGRAMRRRRGSERVQERRASAIWVTS